MAQLTSGLCSTFGFLCCLLFLPASWEAGANTFQELQKTGKTSIFDHLLPLTPGFTPRAPSDHADRNSGQRPPAAAPNSMATQEPKKQCNTVRLAKPTHKPVATDSQNTTVHREIPPAVEKSTSRQRQDPMIRNGRSADGPKSTNTEKGSERKHSTSAPRRTCQSTTSKTRVTRSSGTPVSPVETSTKVRTTSQKAITAPHDSVLTRRSTSSSVKPTEAPRPSYRTLSTPGKAGAEDHRTLSPDNAVQMTTEHSERESLPTRGKTTTAQAMPTEHSRETTSANESTTGATVMSIERHTVANGNTTHVSAKSTDNSEEAASTTRKSTEVPTPTTRKSTEVPIPTTRKPTEVPTPTTRKPTEVPTSATRRPTEVPAPTTRKSTEVSESSTVFWRKTTPATKTIKATGNPEKTATVSVTPLPPVRSMEHKATTPSLHLHKTETTRQGLVGSSTSGMVLRPSTSEANYPQENTHSSPGGLLDAGARGERNPFPAWAIVVVILMAVIILLILLGLIFLVSCASRARHVLTQDAEDTDPEDKVGRNSYPVYLMEQQNLKPNQIPSPS
ncbi:mucin-like protein 3 [Acomys russatus]|uniref:mucin-like protein 3 n=1 Tax=Acomys russatus TaxID=60746 RepID=UPI0021E2717E|nr:mucin-like protein 3 [Acomys russatus]